MRGVIAIALCLASVAHADDKCVIDHPVVAAPAKVEAPPCRRAPVKIRQAIAAEIRKAYMPERGGKPEITFPCDGLGAHIYEIVLETGSGHGGTLQLWRARRRGDGTYDARGILYHGNSMTHRAAAIPHEQASGTVALPALATARAAMTARIREVVPPPKPGEGFGMSSSGSSRDFHILLRLVDDEGRVVERRFTGYQSSSDQDTYLGLEIALRALAPIWQLPANTNPADHDDRLFFAASFNAAVPQFDQPFSWWVMERYVDLARFLGTPAVIGGLLTRLANPKTDRSAVDARADAVDAIARITGWDARAGGKSVEDAAKAYLNACR